MLCPKCETVELNELEFHKISIHECPECKGVWFDLGELEDVLEYDDLNQMEGIDAKWSEGDDAKEAACPRCGGAGKMVPVHNAEHDIRIDTCTVCHGKWLDGGELHLLKEKGIIQSIRDFLPYILP